jgi:hypothetical protein
MLMFSLSSAVEIMPVKSSSRACKPAPGALDDGPVNHSSVQQDRANPLSLGTLICLDYPLGPGEFGGRR